MLISTYQFTNLLCRNQTVNKTRILNCTSTWSGLYEIDQALYAGWIGLILSLIFLLLHIAIFVLNRKIGNDFVKCFTTATTVPLTFGAVSRIIEIILGICMPEMVPSFWVDFFAHIHTVCLSAAYVTALLGMVCFLYSHAFVVCTRTAPDLEESWSMFFTVELIGWLLSGLYHLTFPTYRKMPNFVMVAAMYIADSILGVAIVSALLSALICGRGKRENNDPVVARATVRLLWAVLSSVIIVPCGWALSLYIYEAGNYEDLYQKKIYLGIYFEYRILEFFSGPYMTLCTLLLPTYRNAILVLIGKKENPKWAVKVGTSGAPLINQQMQATEIA